LNEVRICGLKHQKEKRSMDHFAGLDTSTRTVVIDAVSPPQPPVSVIEATTTEMTTSAQN
jgi:hypothetical protein